MNEGKISCSYPESTLQYDSKVYQSYNKCKLDNNWEKLSKVFSPVKHYKSKNDGAMIKLTIDYNLNESLIFKKGVSVKMSNKMIQYNETDLLDLK